MVIFMNKYIIMFLCFVNMFVVVLSPIYAYDYVNDDNRSNVEAAKRDIYSLKYMYEELAGEDDEDDDEIVYEPASVDAYWWPIGSTETKTVDGKEFAMDEPETVSITSMFGATNDVSSHSNGHGGLDIGGGRKGETNIIAAKDGTVIYPTDKNKMTCPDGGLGNTCGGGYGNYVIIQHSDGNYTLYGHMFANSITVQAGDTVKRGQVIGKMGTSGDSSGPHLHFEFRLGENTISAHVDPLSYVDPDNPRPKSASKGDTSLESLLVYINTFEGVGCWGHLSEEGNNYVACQGSDPAITIGHGITWGANKDKFIARGVNDVSIGTRVPKEIVDDIELEVITELRDSIKTDLANNGIDNLKDYQINALISQTYNGGYTVIKNNKYNYDFITVWKKYNGKYQFDDVYKNQGSLWYDSLCRPYAPGSVNEEGLKRRRVSEWMMFNDGTMDYLDNGFNSSEYAWPE